MPEPWNLDILIFLLSFPISGIPQVIAHNFYEK